jgi:hypothetical protein
LVLEVSPPPGPGEEESDVSEHLVSVENGFITAEGCDTLRVGEVVRCLECGSLAMGEGAGLDGCGPFAVYTYHHSEDEQGTVLHTTPEQAQHLSARIAALEGALREVRKALRQEEMEGSRAAAIVEAALGEEEEGWARG